jgi:hypothetical protein
MGGDESYFSEHDVGKINPRSQKLEIVESVVKDGGSGSVYDYLRVTIYNGVLLQGELYSRQPSKLVGKLVSKP